MTDFDPEIYRSKDGKKVEKWDDRITRILDKLDRKQEARTRLTGYDLVKDVPRKF
jgi:hypothetical protein